MNTVNHLVALLLLVSPVSQAHAEEAHTAEVVEHYEAVKPENKAQAIQLMNKSIKEIAEALTADVLDSNVLEAIHEKSYALESAAEVLQASAEV